MAGEAIVINTLVNQRPERIYRNPRMNGIQMFRPVPVEQEPKRENRFAVEFPGEFELESFLVQKLDKPSITITSTGYEWNNIKIEFIDVIGPNTSRRIYDIIEFCKKQKNKKKWFFFKKKQNILFTIYIKSLDPTGVEIERWAINVKDLVSADFGDLDYGSGDMQKCSMTLKPSYCVLEN
jgi:hypothetical protein